MTEGVRTKNTKNRTAPLSSWWISLSFLLQVFLRSRVLLQSKTWAWTKTKVYAQSVRHGAASIPITVPAEREIHSLIPGRQCPKASCYSHGGNVSAFNGIVNRNAFPRGSEEDWHCCSDCYTPNRGVSHINIPILSQLQRLTHLCICVSTHMPTSPPHSYSSSLFFSAPQSLSLRINSLIHAILSYVKHFERCYANTCASATPFRWNNSPPV